MVSINRSAIEKIMEREGIKRQSELAEILNLSPSYVSRVLRGIRPPSMLLLDKLKSKFPEYQIEYFFTFK